MAFFSFPYSVALTSGSFSTTTQTSSTTLFTAQPTVPTLPALGGAATNSLAFANSNPFPISMPSFQTAALSNSSAAPFLISNAQTTLSLFNACSGSGGTCDSQNYTYWAGVVAANPTATVFAIDCVSSNNQTACGSSAVMVTQGPNMFQRAMQSTAGVGLMSVSCSMDDSTTGAVCVELMRTATRSLASAYVVPVGSVGFGANSINATKAGQAAMATTTVTFGSDAIYYNALVVTNGAEKLQSSSVPSATNTPPAPTSIGPVSGTDSNTNDANIHLASSLVVGLIALISVVLCGSLTIA